MAFLDQIISQVNTSLTAVLNQFKYKAHGIAEILPFEEDSSVPMLVDATGNEFAAIDDRFQVVSYHIAEQTSYSPSDNSFGDGYDDFTAETEVRLIVWAHGNTNLTPAGLCKLILAGLPLSVTITDQDQKGLYQTVIEPVGSQYNKAEVFNSLYNGVAYQLPLEDCLVAVTYRVTSEINRECLDTCGNC